MMRSEFKEAEENAMKGIVVSEDSSKPTYEQFDELLEALITLAGATNDTVKLALENFEPVTRESLIPSRPDKSEYTVAGEEDLELKALRLVQWVMASDKAEQTFEKYDSDMKNLFRIILEKISPGIKLRVDADPNWRSVKELKDTLGLLAILVEVCCSDSVMVKESRVPATRDFGAKFFKPPCPSNFTNSNVVQVFAVQGSGEQWKEERERFTDEMEENEEDKDEKNDDLEKSSVAFAGTVVDMESERSSSLKGERPSTVGTAAFEEMKEDTVMKRRSVKGKLVRQGFENSEPSEGEAYSYRDIARQEVRGGEPSLNFNFGDPERGVARVINFDASDSSDDDDIGRNIKEIQNRRNMSAHDKYERDMILGLRETYPGDTYSFIAYYSPLKHPAYFFFGILVYIFQMFFLLFMILNIMHDEWGMNGEVDNPTEEGFGKYIPANVTDLVRYTQITAVLSYVIIADSSVKDCATAVEQFPRIDRAKPGDNAWLAVLSCILRFAQGIMAILATFLLIVTSNDVIEIILNFAAVNFISTLDECAFNLAKWGKYGPALEKEAKSLSLRPLPYCTYQKHQHRRYLFTIIPLATILLSVLTMIIYFQSSNKYWVTKLVRVQFREDTGLQLYSGCYELDPAILGKRKTYNSHPMIPHSATFGFCKEKRKWVLFKNDRDSGAEGGVNNDACTVDREYELAHSSSTDYFDINTSTEDSWFSASGTPLALYFFESDNEGNDLKQNCESFLDNGKCDLFFNTLRFQYDGGDCCADTCTHPDCGQGGADGTFGSSSLLQGIGFRNCVDPAMVPVTLILNMISSSRDKRFLSVSETEIEEFYLEWGFDFWDESPVKPFFNVDCDHKHVISIYIDKFMESQKETFLVRDGAHCEVIVTNTTDTNNNWDNTPVFWVDFTIYHGDDTLNEMISGFSGIADTVIFQRIEECYFEKLNEHIGVSDVYTAGTDTSFALFWLTEDTTEYSRCRDPFLTERFALAAINFAAPIILDADYVQPSHDEDDGHHRMLEESISTTGSLLDDLDLPSHDGVSVREVAPGETPEVAPRDAPEGFPVFMPNSSSEELTLGPTSTFSNMFVDSEDDVSQVNSAYDLIDSSIHSYFNPDNKVNEDTLWIKHEHQCRWNNIVCNEGSVESLIVKYKDLDGTISTAIGLLSNLKHLEYEKSGLTGSIPSEFGLLNKLTKLRIDQNKLTGTLPTELGSFSNMVDIEFFGNKLTGTIPTELGDLKRATLMDFRSNQLWGQIPKQIFVLTNMVHLKANNNLLDGTIPARIGRMTRLDGFEMAHNNMRGTIPTDVGNLLELRNLHLEHNQYSGSLPTEIGLMTRLIYLDLSHNEFTGQIPSEIGLLTELRELRLEGNRFSGSLPFQITFLQRLVTLTFDDTLSGEVPGNLKTLAECEYCEGKPWKRRSITNNDGLFYENGEFGIVSYTCESLMALELLSKYACDYIKERCVTCFN